MTLQRFLFCKERWPLCLPRSLGFLLPPRLALSHLPQTFCCRVTPSTLQPGDVLLARSTQNNHSRHKQQIVIQAIPLAADLTDLIWDRPLLKMHRPLVNKCPLRARQTALRPNSLVRHHPQVAGFPLVWAYEGAGCADPFSAQSPCCGKPITSVARRRLSAER